MRNSQVEDGHARNAPKARPCAKRRLGFRTMAKSAQTDCAGIVTRLGDAGKSKLGPTRLGPQLYGEASRAVAAWLARTQDAAQIGIVLSN